MNRQVELLISNKNGPVVPLKTRIPHKLARISESVEPINQGTNWLALSNWWRILYSCSQTAQVASFLWQVDWLDPSSGYFLIRS